MLNIARVDWPLSRGIRLQVQAEDAESAIALLMQKPLDEDYDTGAVRSIG